MWSIFGIVLVVAAAFYLRADPFAISPIANAPYFVSNYYDLPDVSQLEWKQDDQNKLQNADLLFQDQIRGPESIAFDGQGRGPYTGVSDGRVIRWDGPDKGWTDYAVTSANRTEACKPRNPPAVNLDFEHLCGRPLGLRFDQKNGDLVIADAYKGLMRVGPQGGLAHTLTKEAAGVPFSFTNDLDIDDEGVIYFTDSSTVFQRREFLLSLLACDNTGRLLKYDSKTNETTVLLGNLAFANGVALNKDQSFVVVAEGLPGRLLRYWLKGPKSGTSDVLALLPGHPDNVRTNEKGEFWVAIHCRRNNRLRLLAANLKLRLAVLKLPIPLKTFYFLACGKPHGMILKYSPEGELLEILEDKTGRVSLISEVEERNGTLWLGTVIWSHIAAYPIN